MPALISLGGQALYGIDSDGVEWKVLLLEGWDSAPVRLDMEDRPSEHGAFLPVAYYGARRPAIEGSVKAPSEETRRLALSKLAALTSPLGPATLRVDEAPFSRQAQVWRADEMTVVDRAAGYARFRLPLVAPDPRRYDTTETNTSTPLPDTTASGFAFPVAFPFGFGAAGAGGDVTVTNVGDISAWPQLTITAGATDLINPVVRNNSTGDELRFGITLAAGDSLVVNTQDRTVLLNGTANRRTALLSGSRWPGVDPGSNTFQFRASSYDAAAALAIRFRSAWS